MSLAMDLAACMLCGGENGTNGCHLAVFSVDIAFSRHFVATHLPSHPIGVLLVLATPTRLSKMTDNSASYSLNSW